MKDSAESSGNPFKSARNTRETPSGRPAPATCRSAAADAPPSYIDALSSSTGPAPGRAVSVTPSHASSLSIGNRPLQTDEDPYAFLATFDTVFLIDDSGSMFGASWRETRDVLRNIAPVCAAHDVDGVDVYFLNTRNTDGDRTPANPAGGFLNITSADTISRLFETVRPHAATPTGTRLQQILNPYLTKFEQLIRVNEGDAEATGVKPVNVIVITDGVPTDDPESVLLNFAKRLDRVNAPPYQLGVQFFQVGNERGAAEALKQLDDQLGEMEEQGGVRDIVDTTTWNGQSGSRPVLTADGILKAVLGAVVKRLDRQRIGDGQYRSGFLSP